MLRGLAVAHQVPRREDRAGDERPEGRSREVEQLEQPPGQPFTAFFFAFSSALRRS